jgi:predicted kinase
MMSNKATLHMLCGKIAAGKSTLTAQLGRQPGTITVSEDQWLARLYTGEMVSVADYVRCSTRLRQAMTPHLVALLQAGLSVVLDFPANTVATRNWMRSVFEQAGAAHCLHVLDVPDAVCKARLRERNKRGDHDFAATDAEFDLISSHFMPPGAEEGFDIQRHG